MESIRIATFADLLANDYHLTCWCSGCRRFAQCNLRQFIDAGLGQRAIAASRPTCRKCGSRGRWVVQPPVPQVSGASCTGSR
jgi:hypothetical protein